jgi:4-amino-4-deoxy-L-arabinose transferase-like glycosyltransferase
MPGKTSFLLAAALAGLLLRLAFGLGYWVNQPLTRDEAEYLSLARSLAAGHGFVYDAALQAGPVEPFGRAPGYPFWLALTGAGNAAPSSVPTSVKVVQAITGVAGVFLIGAITRRLAGQKAAAVAAALAAVYPPLVWMSAYALSEAVFWPLALLAAWTFDRSLDANAAGRRSLMLGLAAGALIGAAVLVRPATSIGLLMVGAWLAWRRRAGLLAAVAIGAVLVIGPWSARNLAHYGRFVLVATEGGVTFWTGNNALARGEGDMAANPDIKLASQALKRSHPDLNEESMEPVYYREALRWIGSHPVDWTILEARKLFFLIVPVGPSYRGHSPRYFWASVLSYGLALPLAVAGAWRLRGRFSRAPGFWLLAGSAVVVCLMFFPQDRFRVPLIDSALVVCAGAALGGVREEQPS